MAQAQQFPFGFQIRRGPVRPFGTLVEVVGDQQAVWSEVSTSFELDGCAVVYDGAMLPLVPGDEAVVVGRYTRVGRLYAHFVGLPRLKATFGPNHVAPSISGALLTLFGLGLVALWIFLGPGRDNTLLFVAIGGWCVIWGVSNISRGIIESAGRELLGRALLHQVGGRRSMAAGGAR